MTAESAAEFATDPESVLLADAPLVEGLVAAAVAAQAGAEAAAVKDAAEAVYRPPAHATEAEHVHQQPPDATGDFELVNQAGMHARPAAKIAGGLSAMDADVTVNGADGASMTELMMLAAGKGTVLHVEASGPDATKAVSYLERLVGSGFGEP
jgi:PTS hybrid protein